ncbi:Cytochrome c oxidase subunit 6A [Malassezia yamatoensis]|uniref:Cytochrome c oxidase subunit 6A n=1 Tax=Malassezia yamatoensis TaxID=253288 RepID=A0AAJ5YPG1_9BASI|nr:Cytochrome c oxidase subunit 6A [Malassezia yamatoensis]
MSVLRVVPRAALARAAKPSPIARTISTDTKATSLWRNISLYVMIPGSVLFGAYAYKIESAHHEHQEHILHENDGQLPERPPYPYLNIRKKKFPWGNQSLFFNPDVNYAADEE